MDEGKGLTSACGFYLDCTIVPVIPVHTFVTCFNDKSELEKFRCYCLAEISDQISIRSELEAEG